MFLPGESQGWGSLVGCCLWGHTESDTTEVTAAAAVFHSRRKQQSTPVFLPGKSHGQRSLAGYSPWGDKRGRDVSINQQQQLCMYKVVLSCWSLSSLEEFSICNGPNALSSGTIHAIQIPKYSHPFCPYTLGYPYHPLTSPYNSVFNPTR